MCIQLNIHPSGAMLLGKGSRILRWMNAIFDHLPVWHDHTPGYTSALSAERGTSVTIRLKTLLDPVRVKVLTRVSGEIFAFPAQEIEPSDGEGRWFGYSLSLEHKTQLYCWVLEFDNDRYIFSRAGLTHAQRPYRDWFSFVSEYQAPEWVWNSVFYQIFPDRFRVGTPEDRVQSGQYRYPNLPRSLVEHLKTSSDASPFLEGREVHAPEWQKPLDPEDELHAHYGGDLEGIVEALPYLKSLGITALWLNPIFDSPSNHRYDTRDYRKVDPHLGGQPAFERLIQALKADGFRIVLDGVFNHVGNENGLFMQAYTQPESASRNLFNFHAFPEAGKSPYHSFFDVPTLPKINYADPSAFDEFIDGPNSVVRHWLRLGIDGWRLDVAQMMGKNGTDQDNLTIHERLKAAAREENPEAYVLGERFQDAEVPLRDALGEDGVMNYHGFALPFMEWLSGTTYLGQPVQMGGEELLEILWDAYHVLPAPVALNQFNFLDTHDLPRALFRLNQHKSLLKAGLAVLMSYPGVPCLFYGTEIGLTQEQYGGLGLGRVPMPWDEAQWDRDLWSYTRHLVELRTSKRALQQGNFRLLAASEDAIAFLREYTHGQGRCERMVCVAARSLEPVVLDIALPMGHWIDHISGAELGLGGAMSLEFTGALLLEDLEVSSANR
ncbi:MAG: alpha-amylase family glycosyl hydrolase [Deinococcaceae bacterium]